ncbi:MAG TPA: hypothetical protein H9829_01815 [Candidatus Tetragenococcus pullicola]|nr:hypothetical protein [Candidatus Tetragenococcus pullicola]
MKKIVALDGEVYLFLSKMYELVIVNVFVLLFSLPIITVTGALITGFQLLAMPQVEKKNLPKLFFKKFKENSRQSFKIEGIIIGLLLFCGGLVKFSYQTPLRFLSLLLLAFAILFCNTLILTMANQKKFHSFRETMMYSAFLTIHYTGYLCLGTTAFLITFLIPVFLPKIMFLWFFLGLSFPMFLQEKIVCFCEKHMSDRMQLEKGAM